MMHLLILEGVLLSNFNIHADKQNGCLTYAKIMVKYCRDPQNEKADPIHYKLMLVTDINYLMTQA